MQQDDVQRLYVQYGCGLCAPERWMNFGASPSLRVQSVRCLVSSAPATGSASPRMSGSATLRSACLSLMGLATEYSAAMFSSISLPKTSTERCARHSGF